MEIHASKFWTVLGKIALLIAIIGGGVKLWHDIAPAKQESATAPKVTATISFLDYQLPPDLAEQLIQLRNLGERPAAQAYLTGKESTLTKGLNRTYSDVVNDILHDRKQTPEFDIIGKYLKEKPERAERHNQEVSSAIGEVITDYVSKAWTIDNKYSLHEYRSYLVIKIENEGDRQASNVELAIPQKGSARIEATGEKPRSTKFDGKLSIGNILPKSAVMVHAWTDYAVGTYSWEAEKWQVKFTEGIGTTKYEIPAAR